MRYLRHRWGFALPMVILVMFVLVGAIAAGFAMLSSERAADDASIQAQSAVALAETGLQQGLRNRPGLGLPRVPPAGIESTRVQLTGGYADVVTTLMRPAQDTTVPALYYVRSRGVRTVSGFPGAGNAVAMASAFATYLVQTIKIDAAMTGINGINKNGNAGSISGYDQCNPSAPPRAAVSVPTNPGYTGPYGPLQGAGSPPITNIGSNPVNAATGIPYDWADVVSGSAITPDFLVPSSGAGFPSQAWFAADTSRWPTIIVNNGPVPNTPFRLTQTGRGLLIVYGDLDLNGSPAGWNGIILVGGRITSNGTNQVIGATVTGLNAKIGLSVATNDMTELNGAKDFLYSSCFVRSALTSLGALRVYQNTWANNYPTY